MTENQKDINKHVNTHINRHIEVKRLSILAFFLASAVVLGYLESLIPYDFGVPGIKLGLPNIVSLIILYLYRGRDAVIVGVLRIFIIGFMFGNMYMIIYSLSGLLLSITLMIFLKKSSIFSIIGISVAGAVSHNIGQMIVAYLVVRTTGILFYVPILLLSAVIAGICTGVASTSVLKILRKM